MVQEIAAKGFVATPNPGIKPRRETQTPLDHLKERAEKNRAIREELRYKELSEKAKNQTISKEEQQELRYLTIVRKAEGLADVLEPKVCYLA